MASSRTSYAAFYARARKLASALVKAGIKKGDTVSAILANTPAMLECHYGVPMMGAVLNTLNTRLDAATIGFSLDHAETKFLIVDKEFSGLAKNAIQLMKGPKPIVVDYVDPEFPVEGERLSSIEYEQFIAGGDAEFEWLWPADEWEAISLNYTSGTTGNPKGVVYHHRGAYLMGSGQCAGRQPAQASRLSLDAADVPLQWLVFPLVDFGGGGHPCDAALGALEPDLERAGGHTMSRISAARRL